MESFSIAISCICFRYFHRRTLPSFYRKVTVFIKIKSGIGWLAIVIDMYSVESRTKMLFRLSESLNYSAYDF